MNLTTDPWIPVSCSPGQTRLVSLSQVFAEGKTIQDLAVRPHERVALMRLLICVAQAALDGPTDSADLESCGARLPQLARHYLEQWQEAFQLFHPARPFLQLAGLSKPAKPPKKTKRGPVAADAGDDDSRTAATKLDFALATGNNTTLFDHAAAGTERAFAPHHLALMLVTFQCFSPGGRIGVARWGGQETPGKGSSGHAPCAPSAMLHAFIRRPTLLDTICANLLSRWTVKKDYRRDWGRPVWQQMPHSLQDSAAVANATNTYLGRLMPLSRAILLREDGTGLLLANGLDYPTPPDFSAEPTASVVRKRDGSGHVLVGAGSKAIWRELPGIMVKRLADDGVGGPLVLGDLDGAVSFDLWVGALITDKASILDTVEAVYYIPARMLNENGRRAYESEVNESEQLATKLKVACKIYRQHLEPAPQAYPEAAFAERRYWTNVEQQLPLLHASLNASEDPAALARWRGCLWNAARDAFRASCALETPRQLRAHALALRSLTPSRSEPDNPQPNGKPQ